MMMRNYDESFEVNYKPDWPYITDHSYKDLMINGTGLGKTNVLLNFIKYEQSDIDKIYLYVKDPFESKCQLFTNGKEKIGIKQQKIKKHSLIIHKQLVMLIKI